MADEFEWRTDVDSGWEPQEPEPAKAGRRPSRRLKLVGLAAGAILLLLVSLWILSALGERVEEATVTAEGGLLMAHELLVRGALAGDRDMVETVVSKRPTSWHDLNSDLVASQLFFSRRPLGIEVKADQQAVAQDIRLSPELDGAEIAERRPYSVLVGEGITETIVLERVFHYERAGDRWQLSAPSDEKAFWGNWVTDQRKRITLIYPERDEEVAIKLSAYLDGLLVKLCATEGMNCPDVFHLEFKLDSDPTSIRRLGEGVYAIRASSAASGDRLVLPAPSLVGKPVDESGVEALKRGYAAWIAMAIAAGYGSPESSPSEILAQVDLEPPPAAAWPLPRSARSTFPSGSAGPSQDVLMLCSNRTTDRLLRFDTASGSWREEPPGDLTGLIGGGQSAAGQFQSRLYLSRLPDYRSVVVHTAAGDGDEAIWRSYLWREGVVRVLTEERLPHYLLPPRLQLPNQPSADKLTFFVPGDDNGAGYSALLLDMEQCDSGPCTVRSLPGMPIWSPNGERTLVIVAEPDSANTIYLGDAEGEMLAQIGAGQSPVWLDEKRFLYIEQGQSSQKDLLGRSFEQQVVQATIDDGSPVRTSREPFFSADSVRAAFPTPIRPESLALWTVQPALNGQEWWYVTATDGQRDFVLVYNPASGEAKLVAPLEGFRLVQTLLMNATSQRAIVTSLSADGNQINVELIDAASGEMRRLADLLVQDWSADGDWLIQSDQGVLYLVSAVTGAEWPVRHNLTGCHWAVWIEK